MRSGEAMEDLRGVKPWRKEKGHHDLGKQLQLPAWYDFNAQLRNGAKTGNWEPPNVFFYDWNHKFQTSTKEELEKGRANADPILET